MDVLYGTDQKLGDMEASDMTDFLDGDMFNSSLAPDNYMDNDWLNCFFDDPVLNDKMITDAAQPPCIKSEHSYSLNDNGPGSPLGLGAKIEEIDVDFLGHNTDLSHKTFTCDDSRTEIKTEVFDNDPLLISVPSPSTSSSSTSVSKQPTIILATSSSSMVFNSCSDQPVFPTITVKQEPPDTYEFMDQTVSMDQIVLPPTPPSSASSDSEGSLSPGRSAPSSPMHIQSSRHHLGSSSKSHPIFVNPLPQSGMLLLSEEEKRTLVSEGYPVPSKLPLTKQEEKNLKKIRRKIKNKISAQESRRKKKEYLEALEKRVESYNQENCDLKKKVDSLENNQRSLLGQLHKLQLMVSKMPRPSASATQTGSVLMVLVLCFAVFLGSWSPTSLNIGYSSGSRAMSPVFMSKPEYIRPAPDYGPSVANAKVHGHYATPNMKSRMLLSLKDDIDESLTDEVRTFYPWDRSWCSSEPKRSDDDYTNKPTIHEAAPDIVDSNRDEETNSELPILPRSSSTEMHRANVTEDYQATMHPDIAVAQIQFRTMEQRANFSVEIETA